MVVSTEKTDKDYWESFTGDEFYYKAVKLDRLREFLKPLVKPDDVIINLMCGKFAYLNSYLGVDIVEHMLRSNREIARGVVFDLNSPSHYPLRENSFDVAVMISGIAYLYNPRHTFLEVLRVLRPGGQFIVGFDHNQTKRASKDWERLNNGEKLGRLEELYLSGGFVNLEVFEYAQDTLPWTDFKPEIFYITRAFKL